MLWKSIDWRSASTDKSPRVTPLLMRLTVFLAVIFVRRLDERRTEIQRGLVIFEGRPLHICILAGYRHTLNTEATAFRQRYCCVQNLTKGKCPSQTQSCSLPLPGAFSRRILSGRQPNARHGQVVVGAAATSAGSAQQRRQKPLPGMHRRCVHPHHSIPVCFDTIEWRRSMAPSCYLTR